MFSDVLFLLGQVEHTNGTELQACTMTEEANVTCFVEHTGMVTMVNCIWIIVTSVGSNVMSLTSFLDVAIDDNFSVNGNGDVVALNTNFLFAPFTKRLVLDALCRDDAIHGAMHLIFAQTSIDGVIVVENLHFAHTVVSCIDAHRGTDADTIVHARTQEAELEAEDEVTIFLLGIEVALVAVIGRNVDAAVDGHITHLVAHEVVKIRTVEEELKALLLFLVGEDVGFNWFHL